MFTWQSFAMARPIVPSNANNFTLVNNRKLCDAIYVGGAGIVAVILEDGTEVDFTAVAGGILPVKAIRVNSTNTTASLMMALYIG